MRKYLLLILLVILATSSTVPKLTNENFLQELTSNQIVFVKFYSPNCAYCLAMAPQYQLLYQQSLSKKYKIFQVDCTQEKEVCTQNNVQGYPSLQLFVNGVSFQYQGDRNSSSISKWIEGLLKSKINILSAEDVKKKIGKQTFVLIGGLGQKSLRIVSIANQIYDYGIKYYGAPTTAFIRLYKEGSTSPQQYITDESFPKSLVQWAFVKSKSAVTHLTKQILKYAQSQKQYEYLLILINQQDGDSSTFLTQWCSKNIKTIFCLRISKQSSVYEQVTSKCKVNGQKPIIAIVKNNFELGYHFNSDTITQDSLSQFYQNAKADKIDRAIDVKRDLQAQFNHPNVAKLTKATYKNTIKERKYVFVFYYKLTCKFCAHIAEIYGKVGDHFKEVGSNITIASIESNSNDPISKDLGIKNYPHIRLFINGHSIIYDRQRNAESMIKFITELTSARLQKIAQIEEISSKTFVIVNGVDQDTHLHALPSLFKQHPIYYRSQGQFSIEFHHKIVRKYVGKIEIWDIVDLLQIQSLPVLVSLGQSQPNKKLRIALVDHTPILAILNKYQRSTVSQILDTLADYCLGKKFICGYIHKDEPDYQMLNEWIGDSANPKSGLFWINTEKSLKYKYEGEISQLTVDKLQGFVEKAQTGKIAVIGKKSTVVNSSQQL